MTTVTSTAGLLIGFKAIASTLGTTEESVRDLHAEGRLPFKVWKAGRIAARRRDVEAHRAPPSDPAPSSPPPSSQVPGAEVVFGSRAIAEAIGGITHKTVITLRDKGLLPFVWTDTAWKTPRLAARLADIEAHRDAILMRHRGIPRQMKELPMRRTDCLRYGDCLMDAALKDRRFLPCRGCTRYEADPV